MCVRMDRTCNILGGEGLMEPTATLPTCITSTTLLQKLDVLVHCSLTEDWLSLTFSKSETGLRLITWYLTSVPKVSEFGFTENRRAANVNLRLGPPYLPRYFITFFPITRMAHNTQKQGTHSSRTPSQQPVPAAPTPLTDHGPAPFVLSFVVDFSSEHMFCPPPWH